LLVYWSQSQRNVVYIAPSAERLFGLAISIKGEAYVAENLKASGYAAPNDSVVSFQSYYLSGVITNTTGSVPIGYVAYSLKAISLGDLGLPSSIAAPRELVLTGSPPFMIPKKRETVVYRLR
jgi:hypothetical protein